MMCLLCMRLEANRCLLPIFQLSEKHVTRTLICACLAQHTAATPAKATTGLFLLPLGLLPFVDLLQFLGGDDLCKQAQLPQPVASWRAGTGRGAHHGKVVQNTARLILLIAGLQHIWVAPQHIHLRSSSKQCPSGP